MTTKFLLPVLLTLCGATFASPALAADYFCRVYSGTDTWEKATVNNGHYKITAADQAAAEKAALSKVAKLKPTAALTRARCETTLAGFAETAAATTTTAASAAPPPSGGDTQYYCMAWDANGQRLPAPSSAGADAEGAYYKLMGGKTLEAQQALYVQALALAKKYHPTADSVECDFSIKSLEST